MRIFFVENLESMFGKDVPSGLYQCRHCEYATGHLATMRNHVESRHTVSSGYNCPVCSKFCNTKNALKSHKSRYQHYKP